MSYTLSPLDKKFKKAPSFWLLLKPLRAILSSITLLSARGNRPLQMEFEDQLNALIYFHLEEHTSGRHLLQVLKEEKFARENVAPKAGIEKSTHRGQVYTLDTFQGPDGHQLNRASGCLFAIRKSAEAGPEGLRLPCSHS
jgi:hypothetical protein